MSVYPSAAHYYSSFLEGFERSAKHTANEKNLTKTSCNGLLSDKAKKRLEKNINWLVFLAKKKEIVQQSTGKRFWFKVNFITLTLPAKQTHTDAEITKVCLGNFLNVCRKMTGLTKYVWRAEAQKNGNIHYHITTDTYIPYQMVNLWWNQSVELLNYVTVFQQKFHHRNPPSTQIRSVVKIKNLAAYLCKYMSKQKDGYRLIESKQWFCSRELSAMSSLKCSSEMPNYDMVDDLIKDCTDRVFQSDYVTSCYGDMTDVCNSLLAMDN